MKRVLFIGHEAGRSGAPIVLLHLLRWLKANSPEIETDLLLLTGGELEDEYEKVTNVFVAPKSSLPDIVTRGADFLKRKFDVRTGARALKLPPFERKYDAVVGNTILSLEYLGLFREKGFRTVCWIHELDHVVKLYFGERFVEAASGA
ncbi:MAG TPA: hypothetical protein VK468_04555, partial [Pyrinomonadaceae bacterium]|nr:hypothetical protein [Pyrinomonadaceae bacterium]